MKKLAKKIGAVSVGMIFSGSTALAAGGGEDPLSDFLGTFADLAGGKWGVGMLLVAFICSAIAVGLVDEKVVWLKRLGWICGAGALVVGAANVLKLFGVS